MSKILILNECNSDNIGDQAISEGMAAIFSDIGFTVVKEDFSCNPPDSKNFPKEKNSISVSKLIFARIKKIVPIQLHSIIWLIRSYRKMKEVISGDFSHAVIGGGQLVLSNINFPLALYLWAFFLKKKGIDYSVIACGAGESFRWYEKYLIHYALKHANNKVYMRDQRSIQNVKKNFGINASFCPDAAYYLHKKYDKNLVEVKHKKKISIICITDYSIFLQFAAEMNRSILTESDYINDWVNITVDHARQGYQICLAATTVADLQQTMALKNALEETGFNDFTTKTELADCFDFLDFVGNAELLTAGRMHALILSQIAGTKINPYLISKKIIGFNNDYLHVDPGFQCQNFMKIITKLANQQRLFKDA